VNTCTWYHEQEDELLEVWELMQIDLRAELAVLSACDMGRGRVAYGEGLIGMIWSLFVAGVPTAVASQWQVPSESTTRLMLAFHKGLRRHDGFGGIQKAHAWRRASLAAMKDPRYRMKPYYWAGFVVVSDGGK
jgi:CHAT domain-containing protein